MMGFGEINSVIPEVAIRKYIQPSRDTGERHAHGDRKLHALQHNSAINSCGAAHGDSGWWCVAVQHGVRPATKSTDSKSVAD